MNNKKLYISLYLSQQEAVLFYSKSLDVLNKPTKAHQINPWHCVNKKLALWSTPTMVITTFVPSCLTSSLLSYWLLYNNKVTGALIIRQLCHGPASEELLGEQKQTFLKCSHSQSATSYCPAQTTWKTKKTFATLFHVNDLLPGLDFSWGVVVHSLSPEAEVKPLFKDALYLKMLCCYLNLPLSR